MPLQHSTHGRPSLMQALRASLLFETLKLAERALTEGRAADALRMVREAKSQVGGE